jgi:hypothetical protein
VRLREESGGVHVPLLADYLVALRLRLFGIVIDEVGALSPVPQLVANATLCAPVVVQFVAQ